MAQPAPAGSSTAQRVDADQPSASTDETLTALEQEVLDEYARLLANLNNVRR